MKWNNWVMLGAGAWLIASPWILGYASYNLVAWNSIVVGTVAVVMALWNMAQ